MKEPMPCKYSLPLLILMAVSLVLIINEEFIIGFALLVAVTLVSVIIGESQFWVEKKFKEEEIRPGLNYKDYAIMCERNGREILSPEEWSKYVRLV